jgi:hypothetical protein
MELTAVSATQFSVAQLTTILCDCFEDYLVPVHAIGRGFCPAF